MNKFVSDFLVNYLASTASGITLALLGSFLYFKFLKNINNQKNSGGDNTIVNINELTINSTKNKSSKIIKNNK